VFDVFKGPREWAAKLRTDKAAIEANRNLSNEGKNEATRAAREAARERFEKWHAPRLAGLDADIAVHRAALMPKTTTPDPKKVEFMANVLQRYSPHERAVFYNSATDDERVAMEAASALLGRVPMKTGDLLEWKPLLDSDMVTEGVKLRALTQNPQGVEKLNELLEIRAMHATVAGHALAEINDVMSR
jgi:hypothetical protein